MDRLEERGLLRLDLPEQGTLRLPLAGFGGRCVAALIDTAWMLALLLAVGFTLFVLALEAAPLELLAGIGVAVVSLVLVVFPLAFELGSRGQTPGKRMMQIRVVSADGSPASSGQLLLRNLLRLVDFLPSGYAVGAVAMFASQREQRLGDLVAGTLVIREDERALEDLGRGVVERSVPASLRGIPPSIVDAASRLADETRPLPPDVFEMRRAEVVAAARAHRSDWAGEDDDTVWAHIVNETKDADEIG
jgi:uncharacterized RDD family membrane protein YckC